MIPKSYFEENQTIYAFTERVIDGDTIRVRHIPGYAVRLLGRRKLTTPLPKKRGIADETLSIRVYGGCAQCEVLIPLFVRSIDHLMG